jgi:hypothetical protein
MNHFSAEANLVRHWLSTVVVLGLAFARVRIQLKLVLDTPVVQDLWSFVNEIWPAFLPSYVCQDTYKQVRMAYGLSQGPGSCRRPSNGENES